jgi:hypothetical protein
MPLTPEQVARRKKRIINPDKSVSTERSATFQTSRGFINVPTIVKGKQLKARAAFEAFRKSGEKPVFFKTQREAGRVAKRRSQKIGDEIKKRISKLKVK